MLIIGDSLIRHIKKPLTTPIENVETHVKSIGGCTVDRLLSLIKSGHLQSLFDNQKHLVLMIGTNSLAREKSEIVIEKFEKLLNMIRKTYSVVRTIGVCTVPDRSKSSVYYRSRGDDGGKSIRKRIQNYNRKLKRLEKNQSINQRFTIIPIDFDLTVHVVKDGLHPNRQGVDLISNAIQIYVDTLKNI